MEQPIPGHESTALGMYSCPFCGAEIYYATAVETGKELRPSAGDPVVCWECGELATVDEENRPRKLTPEELITMQRHPDWWKVQLLSVCIKARKQNPCPSK